MKRLEDNHRPDKIRFSLNLSGAETSPIGTEPQIVVLQPQRCSCAVGLTSRANILLLRDVHFKVTNRKYR